MTVFITLSIGLVVGYLGPFGSYEMPLLNRLLYWVILIGGGHIIFTQTDKICHYFLDAKRTNPILTLVASSLVGALFLSFFVELISHYFFGLNFRFPENFLFFYPKVLALSLVINVVGFLLSSPFNQMPETNLTTQQQPGQLFLKRIPHKLGNELICFTMEDHYLHVYTTKGDHMMLLRMKDALMELKDYPGFQVHRSWWVATDAIVEVHKQPRKAVLTLKNDLQVPVSQKYLSQLKKHALI